MKLNLLVNNDKDLRSGYINIDPLAKFDDKFRIKCDIANLNEVVDNNEAEEIVAVDCIDYFRYQDVPKVINHWISKLAHKAKFTISSVDYREVMRGVYNSALKVEDLNQLLYGSEVEKKNCLTMQQLVDILESHGLNILSKRIQNYRAIVVAERP